jgi:hypothetical protein
MHRFVTTNRMRDFVPDAVGGVADRDLEPGVVLGGGGGEDVVEEVSIAGASSGGKDFVQDAVESVADQDLGPGVILGGDCGEDVVEEVWWRTWRQRKRGASEVIPRNQDVATKYKLTWPRLRQQPCTVSSRRTGWGTLFRMR